MLFFHHYNLKRKEKKNNVQAVFSFQDFERLVFSGIIRTVKTRFLMSHSISHIIFYLQWKTENTGKGKVFIKYMGQTGLDWVDGNSFEFLVKWTTLLNKI